MHDTLTLPGDIPGLLRRGSPVMLATRTYGGSVFLDRARGVVADGGRVATETFGGSPVLVPASAADLALDLTDATGRAHAAWWLASHHVEESHHATRAAWRLQPGGAYTDGVRTYRPVVDRSDRRLLPDGSRWVDAEALRLVCLHVAGRAT